MTSLLTAEDATQERASEGRRRPNHSQRCVPSMACLYWSNFVQYDPDKSDDTATSYTLESARYQKPCHGLCICTDINPDDNAEKSDNSPGPLHTGQRCSEIEPCRCKARAKTSVSIRAQAAGDSATHLSAKHNGKLTIYGLEYCLGQQIAEIRIRATRDFNQAVEMH
jgi:hypothetical protein